MASGRADSHPTLPLDEILAGGRETFPKTPRGVSTSHPSSWILVFNVAMKCERITPLPPAIVFL